jgi:hypothetical protein
MSLRHILAPRLLELVDVVPNEIGLESEVSAGASLVLP